MVPKMVRITTIRHNMATIGQILDMVGPYRIYGEPTVLYFIWFHVDGVKIWDTTLIHPTYLGATVWWVMATPSQCPLLMTI